MRKKSKMKKSSKIIMAALLALTGSFSTVCAGSYEYSFIIVRNVISTSGDEQAWKSNGSVAEVTVGSASSPSSYTSYKIYNYDRLVSKTTELKNTSGNSGDIQYNDSENKSGYVQLRGYDARGTAPNYSTVTGTWKPIK